MKRAALLTLALLLLAAPPALAQDRKAAKAKLAEAYKVYKTDPAKAADLTEAAVSLDAEYFSARQFLGWLYEIQLGESAKALAQHEYIAEHASQRKMKATALAKVAALTYVVHRDGDKAIATYNKAYKLYRFWQYKDHASNLALHLDKVEAAAALADEALKSLIGAIDRVSSQANLDPKTKAKQLAGYRAALTKVKLQVATCALLKNDEKRARGLMAGIESFGPNDQYNLALYRSAQKDADGARGALDAYMATRPTAKARNAVRKFVRNEPLFKQFHSRPDFAKFIQDEAE